jgi:hypothetical protein
MRIHWINASKKKKKILGSNKKGKLQKASKLGANQGFETYIGGHVSQFASGDLHGYSTLSR